MTRILLGRSVNAFLRQIGETDYAAHFGTLVTPRNRPDMTAVTRYLWAADNDCFQGLDKPAFVAMLKRLAGLPNCLFVTVPDVVADAGATLTRFRMWQPTLRYFGLPVALVAQDGLETMPIPWDDFDALFIGGSTEWKLSQITAEIGAEAKRRRKWLHMGRVNSMIRLQYAQSIGCDSVDGTGFIRWSNKYLPLAIKQANHSKQPLWEGLCF